MIWKEISMFLLANTGTRTSMLRFRREWIFLTSAWCHGFGEMNWWFGLCLWTKSGIRLFQWKRMLGPCTVVWCSIWRRYISKVGRCLLSVIMLPVNIHLKFISSSKFLMLLESSTNLAALRDESRCLFASWNKTGCPQSYKLSVCINRTQIMGSTSPPHSQGSRCQSYTFR